MNLPLLIQSFHWPDRNQAASNNPSEFDQQTKNNLRQERKKIPPDLIRFFSTKEPKSSRKTRTIFSPLFVTIRFECVYSNLKFFLRDVVACCCCNKMLDILSLRDDNFRPKKFFSCSSCPSRPDPRQQQLTVKVCL